MNTGLMVDAEQSQMDTLPDVIGQFAVFSAVNHTRDGFHDHARGSGLATLLQLQQMSNQT